ncbi:hypothetical protein BJV78DRAFT_1169271 [Lactifluus subvellereus]|nr:hypothetical protein BJV78DRAFT_1169271 [Lactifluus subvellereus]
MPSVFLSLLAIVMYSIYTRCSLLAFTTYPLDQAMAPTNSCQEIHHIPRGSQPAHFLTSRQSRHYSFRRASLAHKRRFRSRQFLGDSTVVDPSPPYAPSLNLHLPMLSSIEVSASAILAPDSYWSALPQSEAAIRHTTAITAALIAVCILVGLATCAVIGRFAYRRRFLLTKWLRRSRQAEDDLGFVFVEYDESTWVTPAKDAWRVMPSSESDAREPEGGEAHARVVASGPLTTKVEENTMPVPSTSLEASRDAGRGASSLTLTRARDGSRCELSTIVESSGRGLGDAAPTQDFRPPTVTHEETEISNALDLVMRRDDDVELSTLASPELAAVLALRAGAKTVDVLAPPTIAEWEISNASKADDRIEETESYSLASDSAACVLSTESSGSEEDFELNRVETRSMDFEHKKSPLDLYALPRVVISASPSVLSEVFSSRSNRASGVSEATIDLGDFPRPPVIGETLDSISTSLISEIEISLGPIIRGSLGMAGRRASSAPQLTS